MLTVVIPVRNEPLLWWTVRNIWRTADCPTEILVVDDESDAKDYVAEAPAYLDEIPKGSTLQILQPFARYDQNGRRALNPVGNCPARDQGIVAARYDAVLVLDAHCNMNAGSWASEMVQHIHKNPSHVCCTISEQLGTDRLEMHQTKGQYWGATIQTRQRTSQGEFRVYQGVWNKNPHIKQRLRDGLPARTGCIMGGAYLLHRRHYVSRLKRIWKYSRNWGTSEPLISIVNGAMGHDNVVLPHRIGHVYRTGQNDKVPWKAREHRIRYNMHLAALLANCDDPLGYWEARKWLALNGDESKGFSAAIAQTFEETNAMQYAAWFRNAWEVHPQTYLRQWFQDDLDPEKPEDWPGCEL